MALCVKVVLAEVTVDQLLNNFLAFYETLRTIGVFTAAAL
jgi:hypothetical protein